MSQSKNCDGVLRRNGVNLLDWPPQSPDLNPIENLWAIIKQRRQKKFGIPSSRDELITQIYTIWDELEPELAETLTDSAVRRLIMCANHNGKVTKY